MNVEELNTYKKYRKYAFVSKSAMQSAYEEGEFKGFEKGFQQGFKQGFEQGFKIVFEQIKIITALNAFKEGLTVQAIAKILHISEDEVNQIITKTNN